MNPEESWKTKKFRTNVQKLIAKKKRRRYNDPAKVEGNL